ncbi:MAG: hypothetical protein MI922_30625, partial [Bacteroidales bacterium]|nr:hypothetical protein [Bacteroidales bacterium]
MSVLILALTLFVFNSCEKNLDDLKMDDINGFNENAQNYLKQKTDKAESGETIEYSCFTVKYPVDISFPGGNKIIVNNEEEEAKQLDSWFEANMESEEFPEYVFPVTITLEDGTEQVINSDDDLYELYDACFEGGDIDWDDEDLDSMECFEFVYPVVVVFPGGAT